MHDNRTHPLLAQVPLMVSPFVSLPVATTLPSTYRKLPPTLPPSSTNTPAEKQANKYVISKSGHAAHPDEILTSCEALMTYVQKVKDDADEELRQWENELAARELAEKRRVAPGWLDSDARILQPEKLKQVGGTLTEYHVDDNSNNSVSKIETGECNELDLVFGGLRLHK